MLETCLDRLADAGHRHLIRCALAEEAVAAGELSSARGWLGECDPAPEVLELDSTWRSARARVLLAEEDFAALLQIVGRSADEVPAHPRQQPALGRLRVHALEKLGEPHAARQALDRLMQLDGSQSTRMVEEGLAPETIAGWRREQVRRRDQAQRQEREVRLADLREQRDRLGGAAAAVRGALVRAPIWATGLAVMIFTVQCNNLDPTLGVSGYALCPAVCETCTGPSRVVTDWNQVGPGEWTTNGPEHFCSSPETSAAVLSHGDLKDSTRQHQAYAMHGAVQSLIWIAMLLLVTPLTLLGGLRRWLRARRKRAALDRHIAAVAGDLGISPPAAESPVPLSVAAGVSGLVLAWYGGGVALCALIIAADLLLW